jgi:hypothetical protein
MRTINVSERSRTGVLHVEAPGCIVNIYHKLRDRNGNRVVSVEVRADGKRFSGEPEWWIDAKPGDDYLRLRVVERPELEECGSCGCYHPATFNGDCRDDANRYPTPDYADGSCAEQERDTQ